MLSVEKSEGPTTTEELTFEEVGGRYRMLRQIGRGGMGSVHEVEHVQVGRRFALKMLAPALVSSETSRRRFLREAKIGGSFTHPNVVTVVDYGEHEGVPYLVMELLQGVSLSELLRANGPLDWKRAVKLLTLAARGTDFLHEKGVFHRDIKPSNLFVTSGVGEELLKVLDFGVAKVDDVGDRDMTGAVSTTGAVVGTISYMAPEQLRGEAIDARTDVYALGLVLLECLTGKPAFRSESRANLMYQILEGDCADVLELRPELPERVALIVRRAMAVRPLARFRSARELAEALESALPSESASEVAPKRKETTRVRAWGILLLTGAVLAFGAWSVLHSKNRTQAPSDTAAQAAETEQVQGAQSAEPARLDNDGPPLLSPSSRPTQEVTLPQPEMRTATPPARKSPKVVEPQTSTGPKTKGPARATSKTPPSSPTGEPLSSSAPSPEFDRNNPYL